MIRMPVKLIVGLLLLAATSATPAAATSIPAFSLPQLAGRADLVVVAVARSMQSRWRGPLIVTDVELQIEEVIKGHSTVGKTLIVTVPGGDIEELALTVPGAPTFTVGKRTVSFLRKIDTQSFSVVGMAQGSLAITGTGSDAKVIGPGASVHTVARDPDGTLREAEPAVIEPMSLAEFRNQLQKQPSR